MGRFTDRDKHEQGIWVDEQNELYDFHKFVEPSDVLYPAINKLAHYEDMEELGRLIEVVRCKDCYHRIERCGMGSHKWCEIWEGTTGENDFCSYGVARTEIKEAEAKLKELKPLPVLHGNTLPNSKEEAMKRLGLESNELKELERWLPK